MKRLVRGAKLRSMSSMVTNSARRSRPRSQKSICCALRNDARAVERQRQQVCGDDAHNARVHLVGARRAPCAAEQRSRVAIGVLLGEVGEQRFGVAFARLLVHAHHRRRVPFAIGQRLEHVGDVAGNIVCRRARPERVVAHFRAGEQRAGDRDDVLRKRATFAPANVVERVVADFPVHGGEVKAVDDVPIGPQIRRHLVIQAALGVEHDIGTLALQQVGFQEIARFARAGTAQNEHVVVEAGRPRVHARGVSGGEDELPRVGGAGIRTVVYHGCFRFLSQVCASE